MEHLDHPSPPPPCQNGAIVFLCLFFIAFGGKGFKNCSYLFWQDCSRHRSRIVGYFFQCDSCFLHCFFVEHKEFSLRVPSSSSLDQAPVVQKLDNAIHRINHYPADSVVCFVNIYPLDSDLSGG